MREGNVMADEGFTELAGRRVTLRRFHRDDLTTFVAYRSSEQVARFQSWDAPYRREEGERFIQDIARQHPDMPGEWFQFAVELRSTGQLIGDCAAMPHADDPRQCDIGFTISTEHQGHGYATEAGRLLLNYLFAERDKHRITAYCDPRNVASAALLQRLGMRREAHLRENTWAHGEWTDDLVYALLRDEWQSGSW
jgi:RimJ/RimL family protein N-acetyltransferase